MQCTAPANPLPPQAFLAASGLLPVRSMATRSSSPYGVRCVRQGHASSNAVGGSRQLSWPGSDFTLLFETFLISPWQKMPVAQAATQLRTKAARLWRSLGPPYVASADSGQYGRAVREALDAGKEKDIKSLFWAVQKDPTKWHKKTDEHQYLLQRSRLKTARAWRLKEALRDVYRTALATNNSITVQSMMDDWLFWARRSRLALRKKLAVSLQGKLP